MEGKKHLLCQRTAPPKKRTYNYSHNVERLLREASNLTPEETINLCCGLIKRSKVSPTDINRLKNYLVPIAKDRKASEQQSPVVSSAPEAPQKADCDKAPSSLNLSSQPHHKVSLIVRADLVEEGSVLAFDTEKLVTHLSEKSKEKRNIAGDFAMVDLQGRVVMWCYINRENVCVYNTKHTGLDKEKIEGGISETNFHEILHRILKRNVLVGAAIKEDLKDLGLERNRLPGNSTCVDIQDFFRDQNGEPVSLAQLGEHFTGQPFQETTHSSLADARMTALAYKRMLKFKAEGYLTFSCPEFDEFRAEMKMKKKTGAFKKQWDKCRCFSIKPKFTPRETWGDILINCLEFNCHSHITITIKELITF